jgi:three-Cys-motif partner protein
MALEHADGTKIDEIGPWTSIKLDIIEKYAAAYSTVLSKTGLRYSYIDAFAGPGQYVRRGTEELVPGSTSRALDVRPPFNDYHFIDLENVRLARLQAATIDRPDVHVYHGDANDVLIGRVLPQVRYSDYRRGLCLLDPYNIGIDYETILALAAARSVEVFINFMIMDVNRNAARKVQGTANQSEVLRMDRAWGSDSWQTQFYDAPLIQMDLFGNPMPRRKSVNNDDIAAAYRQRLRDAGFSHVIPPLPLRNSTGATLYYLFFAGNNSTGATIAADVFKPYRIGGRYGAGISY